MHFKLFNPRKSFLVYLVLGVSISLQTYAQSDLPPIPRMWVSDTRTNGWKGWFMTGKLPTAVTTKEDVLKKTIGAGHAPTYFFPVQSFTDLFKMVDDDYKNDTSIAIRIYLGAFNSVFNPTKFPPSSLGQNDIVFIFAPTRDLRSVDFGSYYAIGADMKAYRLPYDVAKNWVGNFVRTSIDCAQCLLSTLDLKQPENLMPGTSSYYSDTWGVFYPYSDLKEFMNKERSYQNTNGNPINGFFITLAAYPDTGIGHNHYGSNPRGYKSRLMLLVDFSRPNGSANEIFSIETTSDYHSRLSPDSSVNQLLFGKKNGNNRAIAGDNGQLCPPNCPCPSPPCR